MINSSTAFVASRSGVFATLTLGLGLLGCGSTAPASTTQNFGAAAGTTGSGGGAGTVSAGGAGAVPSSGGTGNAPASGGTGNVGTGGTGNVGTGGTSGSCATSQTSCSGKCVDTATDPANCGTCGHACESRQICDAAKCSTIATCPDNSAPTGWATQGGSTTGGGTASATTVTSLSQLKNAAAGTTARVITVSGTISGDVTIGSNKTLLGACGGAATIKGHIEMDGSKNVILRNLNVVGYNCTDSPSDCSAGADAISISNSANHIFIDHCDVSDGSDGNIDITHASDYITISWTKFHYSGTRAGDHQFSNLIGHSATNSAEDSGHLRVTFAHDWWADHVDQRMPRVRFGRVHVFDSLYTATGDTYCIGVGTDANILLENSVFIGVKNPIDTANVDPTPASVLQSTGNVFTNTFGTKAAVGSGTAFTPPYTYALDAASTVESHVEAGAGPI